MSIADIMQRKLGAAFAPDALELTDDSHRHLGHAGSRPGGETHFKVRIVSSAFEGVSRVERQRSVMRVLKEELAGQVHALNIEAATPAEAEAARAH